MLPEPEFSVLALIARIMMAVVFLASGIEKSINFAEALDEFAKARLPFLRFTVIATIALHLVASICLIVGWYVNEMAAALAVFTFLATIRVHDFWNSEGEERLIRSRVALANYALVGGLVLLAATGAGSLTL